MSPWLLSARLVLATAAPTEDSSPATAPVEAGASETDASKTPVPETSAPETEAPASEAAPTQSVRITIVGPADTALVGEAIAGRLGPRGIRTVVTTADDFDPRASATDEGADDRLVEVWLVVPARGPMKLVMTDASHAHTLIRTVPIDGAPSPVSVEEAAVIIEEAVTMAQAGEPWPAPTAPTPVEIEVQTSPQTEPSASATTLEIEAATAPPPVAPTRGRFLRGLYLGMQAGAAVAFDEFGEPRFGMPSATEIGYVFGRFRERPDLRVGLGASLGALQIFHPDYDRLSLSHGRIDLRVGGTRGPVWGYGILGVGAGGIRRRLPDGTRSSTGGGVLGHAGVGLAVRLNHRIALDFEGVASGNPSRIGAFALAVGFSAYFDVPRKEGRR